MTDPPRPPILQPVSGSYHNVSGNDLSIAPTPTIPFVPSLTNGLSVEEEEAFTIKCICQYTEDDESTVLCESCNTWQHLDCYYEPQNIPKEEEPHSCIDCEPRYLDHRRANEIQRIKRADTDLTDRKIKKPVKSHKKKVKSIDPLATWSDKHELGSPRNGASKEPTRKKTHKQSNSIHAGSSNAPKLVPRRSASHSLQSPPKTDGPELTGEPYSEEFMHLYDEDPGESAMNANLHDNIAVTNRLAAWSDDVDALAEATNGKKHPDVFLRTAPIETLPQPQLQKHLKEDPSREFHGRHSKWIYLTSDSDLVKESFVGELRGKIGLMKDYVNDESNRWEYLRHPLPFVFFHPLLPIYIDTRNEGSLVRYLRRSCQPNLVLKTFLEGGSDYRFGFVATRDIPAGTELTIPWTTDEHVRAFTQQNYSGIKSESYAETDENYILSWFSKVFADFGGCACDDSEECAINKLARRLRALTSEMPSTNGKKRGPKPKGQRANTSRSGSEALRHKEDDDDDDESSNSSRSKPQSRDMTPQDSKPAAIGLEVSEREKRKIAALEQRMDQDKNQPAPKKKKRTSGPSVITQSSVSEKQNSGIRSNVNQKDGFHRSRQVDASTGRKHSGSPTNKTTFSTPVLPRKTSSTANSPTNPIPRAKPTYVDCGIQTDPDPEDWITAKRSVDLPERKFVSLKRRLLMKSHNARKLADEAQNMAKTSVTITNGVSVAAPDETAVVVIPKDHDGDTVMENTVSASVSPNSGTTLVTEKQLPPDFSPSVAPKLEPTQVPPLHPPPIPAISDGFRNTNMRIPLPPANVITNGAPPTPTGMAQSPIIQSPSLLVTPAPPLVSPSPVKKMSLKSYMMRRGSNINKPELPAKDDKKDVDGGVSPTNSARSLDVSTGESLDKIDMKPVDSDAMDIDTKS